VVEHYPAYTWDAVLEESSLVLAALFQRIPRIHLYRAWPLMQLQAFIGNALGGKQKGGEKLAKNKVYSPLDFVPPLARTPDLIPAPPLAPQHCSVLIQALESGQLKNASWVIQAVELEDDLDRVREVAEGYQNALENDAEHFPLHFPA